ncbi:hypothetical protein KAI04_00295 [Candidatus Pacearchaeota archaeon]|nr:hypothetical protein [Candidatus Pacearchaeota archaeon]
METSTIQLSKETKKKISSFGAKGESYEDILLRLYKSAVERQLHDFLYKEDDNFISIEKALNKAKKKWQK